MVVHERQDLCSKENILFIRCLSVNNFRNFRSINLELLSHRNLILGGNGVGKTNILEAIYLLCYGKSFRGTQDRDMVIWGEDNYSVRGDFRKGYEDIEVCVDFTGRGKNIRINSERLKSISHIVGVVLCVYMGYDDIEMISGAPRFRRRFLDQTLSTVDPVYLDCLRKYIYCLSQRNSVLQGYGERRYLEVEIWDEKLVEFGSYIVEKRIEFLKFLSKRLRGFLEREVEIRYHTRVYPEMERGILEWKFTEDTSDYIKRAYLAEIKKKLNREIKYGFTMVGPHRDNFEVVWNGINSRLYASLGQIRSLTILLKIIQADYYEYKLGQKPILLLDDIFLELDSNISARVSEILSSNNQIIATSTEIQKVPSGIDWERIIRFNHEGKPKWD